MLNIGYFKAQPTEYIIKYASGRVAREGQGLAFFYLRHNTQVVAVPTSSVDANLVFNEVTSNFQAVTIQGQFTYRIHDPKRAAELLNFTMDPRTRRVRLERPGPAGAADHQRDPDGDPHRDPEAVARGGPLAVRGDRGERAGADQGLEPARCRWAPSC